MIPPERWQDVIDNIAAGMNNDDACAIAGISEASFYNRKKDDLEFLESVKRAESEFIKTHVKKIATSNQWQSSAWLLERKYPNKFKEQKKVEHEGIQLTIENVSSDKEE